MDEQFSTKSAGETRALAKKILEKYKNFNVFLLEGELGSGKTTFVQGVASLFYFKQKIQSPTFVLEKKYNVTNNPFNNKINKLCHIDLYRLRKNDESIKDLSENFNEKNQYTFIEWPDRLGKNMPQKYIKIKFHQNDDQSYRFIATKSISTEGK